MTKPVLERVPWFTAEPTAYIREVEAVPAVAPELIWNPELPTGGWSGLIPTWPFDRPEPTGLRAFLSGERLRVDVVYVQAHPMVPPAVFPLDPEPELVNWTQHVWHLNGDGSLCLVRSAVDWDPWSTAADLVVKAAGWFLEYLLLTRGLREQMTENGIVGDSSLDELFA
jgi:hypothetical protein